MNSIVDRMRLVGSIKNEGYIYDLYCPKFYEKNHPLLQNLVVGEQHFHNIKDCVMIFNNQWGFLFEYKNSIYDKRKTI